MAGDPDDPFVPKRPIPDEQAIVIGRAIYEHFALHGPNEPLILTLIDHRRRIQAIEPTGQKLAEWKFADGVF